MKKLFLFTILLIILPVVSHAQAIDWTKSYALTTAGNALVGARAAVSSCTLQDQLGLPNNTDQNAVFLSTTWYAGTFIPVTSYTMTQISAALKISVGSPLYSAVTAYIYTDANPKPGTLIATSTNTVSSTLTSSYVFYAWQFSGVSLTGSTRYHLVLKEASFDGGYNEYSFWGGNNSGSTTSDGYFTSSDGTTWSANVNSYINPTIRTYVGTCP